MGERAEVVCDGIKFPEGPVWCPDGTLVVTGVADGALFRVFPEQNRRELFVRTGGGPNGAALAADGGFLITQNGGIDFTRTGLYAQPPDYNPVTPGLQWVAADGSGLRYLCDDGFTAPNDVVAGFDGVAYFTDPPHHPPPQDPVGRVVGLEPDRGVRVLAEGLTYPNGIALDPDGNLVIIEQRGLLRFNPDGEHEWVVETLGPGGGDGFCLDADGRYYVASTSDHGVRVLDADGKELDFLEIKGQGVTTNCCFGGPEMRHLFATDGIPGHVVVWESLPTPGLALHEWPIPDWLRDQLDEEAYDRAENERKG
jgi:gluconolactonase